MADCVTLVHGLCQGVCVSGLYITYVTEIGSCVEWGMWFKYHLWTLLQ